ncbi:hypothetical protein TH63_09645 [Rufibacter radiotolerans]|uniref:Uncharacterized protein n=1 Tax=Rufibacter radiotolerans TaxID=1379910 RepID=A0A0H4VPJ1_9BACT|nr:hypothetical protein [Rufibacter radiotolerans]AKQ45847.1 hypothetical protein TH63_09645 [Rufibacter radiotolerans]
MRNEYKALLIGFLAVVVLDTVGSIASNQFDFNYNLLWPGSYLIYGAVSFQVTKRSQLKKGILFSVITGLFDATIGLTISTYLQANIGLEHEMTTGYWVIAVLVNSVFVAIVGLIAGRIAIWKNKNRINAQQVA